MKSNVKKLTVPVIAVVALLSSAFAFSAFASSTPSATVDASTTVITEEQAKAAVATAYENATIESAKFESEDGKVVYDIVFTDSDGTKLEAEVNAITAEVTEVEEYDNDIEDENDDDADDNTVEDQN